MPAARRWRGHSYVFNLAADMGGMGFIETNKALCMLSVLINTHLLLAAREQQEVERYFFASSACVYAADKQTSTDVLPLKRGGRLPGDAGGRLRLGEALQRADVPPFHGGLRSRDPRGSLPQRLRPARHVRRGEGEGSGGDLSQGDRGEALRATIGSRSGETASRRAASCTSTTASMGRGRSCRATSRSRSTSAVPAS